MLSCSEWLTVLTNRILLIGAGGHARSCIDVIEQEGKYAIAGLIGKKNELGATVFGYDIVGEDCDMAQLRGKFSYALVCIGQIRDSTPRINAFNKLIEHEYILPSIVSPLAYISPHATIGRGTIVMHGAIVNSGSIIGDNCILNSRCLIEHDSEVKEHCHISTGVILNGSTLVGEGSFVGSGAVTENGAQIEEGAVIPAASFVPRKRKKL